MPQGATRGCLDWRDGVACFGRGVLRVTQESSTSLHPEHDAVATVLVVDDEVLLRLSIADRLRDEGFSVIEAANADEAIGVLQTTIPVHVVLTDVTMPGRTDGIGLARFIEAHGPDTKVILTSGTLVAAPPGCRLDGFFLKPYDPSSIVRFIRSLLQDARPLRRLRDDC
jgi:two-component system, response regulator PdtaR